MPDDKSKKKSKRVLGWGAAENARRKIKNRKNEVDEYLESMGAMPTKSKKKKDTSK